MIKKIVVLFALTFIVSNFVLASDLDKEKNKFRFAFFTDIHLNKGDNNCFKGLEVAIESAKSNNIDFILTGGDNVDIDVLGKDEKTAHELYQRYVEVINNAGIDYHATVGNHDRYFGCKKTNPLYNEGMFDDNNLKLVLQGHQHLYEEIKTLDVQFITAGAVSGSWWGGDYHGTEEGYLIVECEGDEFTWEYVDYGWEVKK